MYFLSHYRYCQFSLNLRYKYSKLLYVKILIKPIIHCTVFLFHPALKVIIGDEILFILFSLYNKFKTIFTAKSFEKDLKLIWILINYANFFLNNNQNGCLRIYTESSQQKFTEQNTWLSYQLLFAIMKPNCKT